MKTLRKVFRRLVRRRRRALDRARFTATLGSGMLLRGTLRSADSLLVCGQVEGNAIVAGSFVLAENGYWQGNITASHVVIAGEVCGNVTARAKLEMRAGARILGYLKSPVIAMAEGAVHDGEVRMARRTRLIRFDERRNGKGDSQD